MRQFPRLQTFKIDRASSVLLSIYHEANAKNLRLSFSSLKGFITECSRLELALALFCVDTERSLQLIGFKGRLK